MKPVVLAIALTGLLSVTALAGNVPTNDVTAPGNIPTSDVVAPPPPPASQATADTGSSVTLAKLVLTIVTLINS
jgi:hypothetical protein